MKQVFTIETTEDGYEVLWEGYFVAHRSSLEGAEITVQKEWFTNRERLRLRAIKRELADALKCKKGKENI